MDSAAGFERHWRAVPIFSTVIKGIMEGRGVRLF
jgi:hypothetical protein